ncbi:hypothetical protein [Methanolobus profundi]|uniref:Uncharacterized protein n=1 Tax=Methanolobus profundi TaxID=487685 RepID=A0A1I4SR15_9EURY|nr:hypothetical protein [Methanolobus profundi]SFM66861.1 hypothetical protein SAMN04488696_1967 [Methanolobus profundi]
MNTENRDFVIERLERQLKEKESEIDDIKTNLRESILREIRSDLKNDLDFHNRIVQLERKVQSLSSNLNGIMDELLDQKSMLRALKESSVPKAPVVEKVVEKRQSAEPPVKEAPEPEPTPVPVAIPKLYRPETKPVAPFTSQTESASVPPSPVASSAVPNARPVPKGPIPTARPVSSRVSVRSDGQDPEERSSIAPSSNVRFNVREVPSVKQPEMPEPEHRSEYIIAETDDERQLRLAGNTRRQTESCNYIVAEEDTPSSCNDEDSEYETVEAREDEDAVVVTTRRK